MTAKLIFKTSSNNDNEDEFNYDEFEKTLVGMGSPTQINMDYTPEE